MHYGQHALRQLFAIDRINIDFSFLGFGAFVEGVAFFKQNKEEALRIVAKKMRIEKGKDNYLERSYQLFATQYLEAVPSPSVNGARTVLEFLVKDFPKAKTADPNSFIDNSLIKPLEDSGFIKALYP